MYQFTQEQLDWMWPLTAIISFVVGIFVGVTI